MLVAAATALALPLSTLGTPTVAPAAEPYVVQPGETLSHVAVRFGTSVPALAAANGIADVDHVLAGTQLVIPEGAAATSGGGGGGGGGGGHGTDLPERLRARPERQAYIPVFERWAARNGVPADLLMAMTWLESGWQQDLSSPTGAVGIGQLMPDTVTFMQELIGVDLNQYDAEDNIRMSARYLRWLLQRYGTASDALAAYYQGPASVERQGTLAETDTYVANVLALVDRF